MKRLRCSDNVKDLPSSNCSHIFVCKSLSFHQLINARKKPCADCSFPGNNRWLCLADSCRSVFCGSKSEDHSQTHYQLNQSHFLSINLSNWRVWCQSCDSEVFADRNLPSWSGVESILGSKGVIKLKKPGELAKTMPPTDDNANNGEKLLALVNRSEIQPKVHQKMTPGRPFNSRGESNEATFREVEDETDEHDPKGLTGLPNLGNTCYMNAALQSLSNCPPLAEFFKRDVDLPPDTKSLTGMEPGIARSFQYLLRQIWSPQRAGCAMPLKLLNTIGAVSPQFRGWCQQDSQEFIRCFLDLLHRELRQPIYTNLQPPSEQRRSISSEKSDRSSQSSAENFETADSGWSSDTDATVIRPRKRAANGHMSREIDDYSDSTTNNTLEKKQQKGVVGSIPPRYRSIITDVFDGRLQSSVQCLTCKHISETTETFQDLSLPIPTKEQLDRLMLLHNQQENASESLDSSRQSWLRWFAYGWMGSLWNYLSAPAVTLSDCLNAFFSPDDLRGEDMYSCEKCAKLRNGVKLCRIRKLPEVLCIHLKRFRHDTAYSYKVNTTVRFPLEELDMSPFVRPDCADSMRQYDLCAFVTHFGGGPDSGHYVAYCRNELNNHWYEFDDSLVSRVEPAEILTKEAYVLFYQKRSNHMQSIRQKTQQLLEMKKISLREQPVRFIVSSEWLNRLSSFSEPGPISNSDFLCPHGFILPRKARHIMDCCAEVSGPAWDYLYDRFGGGPVCCSLKYCISCQNDYQRLHMKRNAEHAAFRKLEKSGRYFTTDWGCELPNCISRLWFVQWEQFIFGEVDEIPSPIDNSCLVQKQKSSDAFRLKPSASFVTISRDHWLFFLSAYGGAPEVFYTFDVQPTTEDICDWEKGIQKELETEKSPDAVEEKIEANEEKNNEEAIEV